MVIPALLATALTACPQAPAPTPNVAPAPTQEQQIEARGLSTPKDMMLHGILAGNSFQSNQGFTLQNGSSVHANTGLILNSRNIVLNGGQVSSTSTATCSDNSGMGFCLKGKPKFIAPMVVIPKADIPALKTKYSATPSITIQGNLNLNSSSEISTRFDNQIILVKGSVNLNAVATIKNATILVEETLSSNKGITLENTRIISKGIGLNQATKLSNSRIITDEDLTVNGTLESLGISSLISSKNITTNQTTSSTTGELAIIANQNITMNQSSSGKIAVWANGNVNLNQVSSLEGSVVAGGKVTLNQRVTLTKVLQHVNGDVLGGGSFENIPETLTLTAGATIRLQNGVVIKAPIGSFDGSVNITVTEVPKERSTIPLPSNMEAVAKYYTIRSSRTIGSGEGFTVGLPIIGQIAPENTTLAQQYLVRYGVGSTVPIDLWSATVNRPFENLAGGILVYLMAEDYLVTAVKYPVGNIIVPNSPSANSGNLKTQATNSNLLEIETIQCDIPNALLNINTCFGLYGEIVDSIKTFTRLLSLTSAEVPIIRILQMKPSNDPECSGIGGYYFQQKIVICVQPDLSVTSGVSAHEVFHAVQERLFFSRKLLFNYTNSNFWIIESTAEAAAFSRETMQSSERSRFPIEKKISDNSTSSYRYQLNDFWVFVGKKLGKGVGFLKDLFVIQHSLQDTDPSTTNLVSNFRLVDTFLKNQGYTSGLSGAYSDWIRSYSIERKILIRSSDTINNVDQSCIPVIDVLQNQDGIRLSLGLSLRMPVAFSSVKNNIGSPLSTQNTYVKFTLSGQGAITSQVRIVARSSKNHVKFVVYERQRGDPPNQNCFDKAESLAPLVTKPGSPDNSFYTFSQNFTVTQKSEFIVLAINSDFTESADIQFRVEDIQAQVAVPSRIDLTGNVGDTLESKITIANTGDFDSTLKYQQYFISSNEISVPPPFFNPSQPAPNAGARAQGIPLRAYPDEGTLTPANGNFLSPRLTSPEIILSKTSATPAPSREIEVKYFCSSNAPTDSTPLDTGNGYKVKGIVNIVYKTGATDDLGEEIQEKVAVPVTVTCEDVRKPKVGSIEFYLDKDKFLINEYPIVKARVSNVGNAPLYVQSNSGTALIQSGETAELFYRGETCTDVRFITFTAIFTTNDTEKVTFNKEFTISCYYFERIQGNSVFVNSDCNPSLCGLYANYDRFGSYLGSVLGARVLNPLFGIINRANRGLPLTTLQDFASKVADFSNFQAYESYTNSIYEAREASAIKCYFNQDGSSAAETNEAVRCARDAYQTSKNNLETFSNSILSRYLSSLNPKYVKNISYTTETVTDVYERIYIRYVFSFDVILTP